MKQQIKHVSKALMHRLGFEVRRVGAPAMRDEVTPEEVAAQTGRDAVYYLAYSTPWPVFSPWVGHPEFQRFYEGVASLTLGNPERSYTLMSLAHYAKHLPGDFAECGVYRGGSALMLCRVLQETRKTFYLFDSFQGLPQPHPEHDKSLQAGELACDVESVKQRLADFRRFTEFREGWIPETFQALGNRRYAFAHIDVDRYQSTLDCCVYFYSRLVPGGVMLFDEYGWPSTHGEKVAVDEYFADKPERPIALITGQALVLKVPPN